MTIGQVPGRTGGLDWRHAGARRHSRPPSVRHRPRRHRARRSSARCCCGSTRSGSPTRRSSTSRRRSSRSSSGRRSTSWAGSTRGRGRTRASASWPGSSSSSSIGSIVGIVFFYGVLVPLGVAGTDDGGRPVPALVLRARGAADARRDGRRPLPDPRLDRVAGLAARRSGPARRGDAATASGPVPTLVYGAGDVGATVLRTIGCGARRARHAGRRPARRRPREAQPGPARAARSWAASTSCGDRPRHRRPPPAHRHPVGVRATSSGAPSRTRRALGLETRTVPALDELVSGRLGRRGDPRGRGRRPAPPRPGGHRRAGPARLRRAARPCSSPAPAARSARSWRARCSTSTRRGSSCSTAPRGRSTTSTASLTLLGGRDSGTASRGGRPRARELVTRLANVASLDAMRRILAEDRPVDGPPRRRLQARADDGAPPGRRRLHQRRRDAGGAARVARRRRRAVRPRLDRQGRRADARSWARRSDSPSWPSPRSRAQSGRRYVAVRFGNVLGSSGSVVPLFQRQLREGVPLTITDPEMTRYFMTIPEASRLILEASLLGEPGDLFVLDMGEPVRIVDLARDLARLAGRDPDSVPIQYIGLRPGEKLHESLFYDAESIEPTAPPEGAPRPAIGAASVAPADVLDDARRARGGRARPGDHEARPGGARRRRWRASQPRVRGRACRDRRDRRAASRSIDRASARPSATPSSRSSTRAG